MKFYDFRQNNSGGSFKVNENLARLVIIEAESADAANEKAQELGIYFDGCDAGRDCYCCGDRWRAIDESDGSDVPSYYGTDVRDPKQARYVFDSFGALTGALRIHYADGRVVAPTCVAEVP